MTIANEQRPPADEGRLEPVVGRLVPERDDEWVCDRCHGDGMDPWIDYLLPCPACQGGQRP